jgi:hypothetical protein
MQQAEELVAKLTRLHLSPDFCAREGPLGELDNFEQGNTKRKGKADACLSSCLFLKGLPGAGIFAGCAEREEGVWAPLWKVGSAEAPGLLLIKGRFLGVDPSVQAVQAAVAQHRTDPSVRMLPPMYYNSRTQMYMTI